MDSDDTHRYRYFCLSCGAGLTDEDMKNGNAVLRADETYCRLCFRKEFLGDCPNHPGVKASIECARCGIRVCENCVVEIQGEQVCHKCKDKLLTRLADNRRRKGEMYCQTCGAAFSMEKTIRGALISRRGRLFCRKCFSEYFPEVCVNHPSRESVVQCSTCGECFCRECEEKLFRDGSCLKCRNRFWFGPVAPLLIFITGILGLIFYSLPGIGAVWLFVVYRKKTKGLSSYSIFVILGLLSALAGFAIHIPAMLKGVF